MTPEERAKEVVCDCAIISSMDMRVERVIRALAEAEAKGRASMREEAARLIETTVLLADDDDPTLDRGKYAAAIRALPE